MVAAAEEAVDRMFVGIQDKLATISEPIQAVRQYPYALWEEQNEPPARAYAELQLASRWDLGLQAQMKKTEKAVSERMGKEIRDAAERLGFGDPRKLMVEIGVLISAMQGLAVSSTLVEDDGRVQAVLGALTRHYNDCLDELIEG